MGRVTEHSDAAMLSNILSKVCLLTAYYSYYLQLSVESYPHNTVIWLI